MKRNVTRRDLYSRRGVFSLWCIRAALWWAQAPKVPKGKCLVARQQREGTAWIVFTVGLDPSTHTTYHHRPHSRRWPSSSCLHFHVFRCQWERCQSHKWLNSLWSPNPSLHLPPTSPQGITLPSPSQAQPLLALPESSSAVLVLPVWHQAGLGPNHFTLNRWAS